MPQTTYNWPALSDFTIGESLSSSIHPRGNSGWDTTKVRISDERREQALARANGILSNKAHRVRFFVTDLEIDIGLSGQTGQGRRTRDFYPHNIVMPVYKVTGICLDQQDYSTLVEFIHEAQHQAIGNGELLELDILAGGFSRSAKTMRGVRKPVSGFGIAERIERTHTQFVYAPTFQFNWANFQSVAGIYTGLSYRDKAQKSFLEIVKEQEGVFSQAPKVATSKGNPPRSTPTQLPATQSP